MQKHYFWNSININETHGIKNEKQALKYTLHYLKYHYIMKKNPYKKLDPFDSASWSLRAYNNIYVVLHDVFSNDTHAYFKYYINLILHNKIYSRPLSILQQKEAFRIYLRINTLIAVAYYCYEQQLYRHSSTVSEGLHDSHMDLKRLAVFCSMHDKSYWRGEWAYWIQNMYALEAIENVDSLFVVGYFAVEIVDVLYTLYQNELRVKDELL